MVVSEGRTQSQASAPGAFVVLHERTSGSAGGSAKATPDRSAQAMPGTIVISSGVRSLRAYCIFVGLLAMGPLSL